MSWNKWRRLPILLFLTGIALLLILDASAFRREIAIAVMALFSMVLWFDIYYLSRYEAEKALLKITFPYPHVDFWWLILVVLIVLNAFLIDHDFTVFTIIASGMLVALIGELILQQVWSVHRLYLAEQGIIAITRKLTIMPLKNIRKIKFHRDRLIIRSERNKVKIPLYRLSNREILAISDFFDIKAPENDIEIPGEFTDYIYHIKAQQKN